jgi:HlyD family secretion protein
MMKKKYLYMILAVVVIGTGGYFWISNSNSKDVKYRTEKVSRGNITIQVRATGTINPVQTVRVGSQVSGTISKLFADFNSQVKKGEIIALIDSTFLNASVKEAQANLERNQAQVNEARRNFNRTSELYKKNLVSQADLDVAQTGYESALAQLKQTQAALDRANVNLRYSIIRAPIDGVVISRDIDVGQTVAASLQAPQLFVIANDLKRMQVEASVDEADIGQIQTGQRVSFTVDSYPDVQFRGTVTQVRLSPVTVQNVVTYTVIIEVPNEDMKLRPGMTATVSVLVDRRDNVLRVSALALRFQPPKDVVETSDEPKQPVMADSQKQGERTAGRTMNNGERQEGRERWQRRMAEGASSESAKKPARVWILSDGKNLRQVTILTGLNDNRYVELLNDALKEGDEVIIGSSQAENGVSSNAQTNPFQQRMPGGGGQRRGF